MKAQQQIQLGLLDPMDGAQAYAVTLMAFGDEDQARKAQSAAVKRWADYKMATGPNK